MSQPHLTYHSHLSPCFGDHVDARFDETTVTARSQFMERSSFATPIAEHHQLGISAPRVPMLDEAHAGI